ncbi:flagellar protein FlaG [Sporolactobacillus laevolacticus]|uniref:Flagellar protein FlaG n=1 Tax=Sporolactobacillus laevolacticus DSM 442 TaxID=1395513 RepID=V6IUD2_9BACL|nr:flagellar protein FlaG [Sporolactobacillus laevolacticus]EST10658.1 flagellar protein FlaG [Sporolactobacillus laevolacticus DSM 442]
MNTDVSLGTTEQNYQTAALPSSVQGDLQSNQVINHQSGDSDKGKMRVYSPFTKKQLDDLVVEANKLLNPELTEMHYVLHDKLNKYYVQVEDVKTHRVIREIPPKKFMDMYAAIAEKLGLIVNKKI